MSNQRYIVFAFVAIATVLGGAVRGIAVPLVARFEMSDPHVFGIANATTLAGFAVGVITFFALMRLPAVVGYTDEVISELKKVHWPDREETVRSSTIVLGTVLVLATILGTYDYVWAQITKIFLFSDT